MVVGKATIQVTEQLGHLTAQGTKDRRRHRPGCRVARIHYHSNLSRQASELPADELLIGRNDGRGPLFSLARGKNTSLDQPAQLLDFLPVDGDLAQADLEPVVFRGIVTASDLQTAVEIIVVERKIHQWGGAYPDVKHIEPGRAQPLAQRGCVLVRGQAAVPSHRHSLLALPERIGAIRLAQGEGKIAVKVCVGNATDVVLTKDGWIHRRSGFQSGSLSVSLCPCLCLYLSRPVSRIVISAASASAACRLRGSALP